MICYTHDTKGKLHSKSYNLVYNEIDLDLKVQIKLISNTVISVLSH